MARSLLVAPAADGTGLAPTCLGLLRALDRSGVHMAYVKPVAQPRADGTPDRSAALVAAVTTLRPPEPLSTAELERQLGEGGLDVVLDKIVAAWEPSYRRSDVVVVEGLAGAVQAVHQRPQPGARPCPGRRRPAGRQLAPDPDGVDGLAEQFAIAAGGYTSGEQARVVGLRGPRLARGPPSATAPAAELRTALARHGLRLHRRGAAPPGADLAADRQPGPRAEPRGFARGRHVAADQGRGGVAQGIPGGIRVLDDGRLVVVPGDRHEVVMAACLAALNGTRLAALLLARGSGLIRRSGNLPGPPSPGCPSCWSSPTATRPPPGSEI